MAAPASVTIISRFQRWHIAFDRALGRWPRLLHFAPLALEGA